MNLTIHPDAPLRGEVTLPGDKSLSHRAALFAALAEGESRIDHFLISGVTRQMVDALTDLGVAWNLDGDCLHVQGRGLLGLQLPTEVIDCGNSATTLRLLAGALAAAGLPVVLDGSPGLRSRPMGRLVDPLKRMGAPIRATDGHAPLRLSARPAGRPLHAMEYTLPVASAQVKSGLLLAALGADGPVTLHEPSLSRDHTERMLSSMGAPITVLPATPGQLPGVRIEPLTQPLQTLNVSLPGDISSAAFLIVGACITPGSEILLRNVGLNPTRTGLIDTLQAMGADLTVLNKRDQSGEPAGDIRVRYAPLSAARVSGDLVVRMIDEFPAFAAAAACAEGVTEVCDVAELRLKESDRIATLCHELSGLGVTVHEQPDGFSIEGASAIAGGSATSHGDHRLAMALTVLGLQTGQPVTVQNSEVIGESFPEFLSVLSSLGAQLTLEAVHA